MRRWAALVRGTTNSVRHSLPLRRTSSAWGDLSALGLEDLPEPSEMLVKPKWGGKFCDRTGFALRNYGMYFQEQVIDDLDVLSTMRFELEDLIGESTGMYRDFDPQKDAENSPQLTALLRSIVTQFPVELNGRLVNLELDSVRFSAVTSQLFGAGLPDDYNSDVSEEHFGNDPRKLSVVFFLNTDWKQSHGGHWRFMLPKASKGIIDPVVQPAAGTVLVYWADTTKYQILPYNAPEDQKLLALHVWLHASSQDSVGKHVNPMFEIPKEEDW